VDEQQITRHVLTDEILVINPGRMLDNNNAHVMVETITSAQAKGYKFIIIDMSGLEFLSSAGVGSILGTVETSREMGGDVILCSLSGTILHVLEVLDLADFLTIRATEKEALTLCGIES
jgi:stage II sporulation protein AA (anti-sigma F factor antagonist)